MKKAFIFFLVLLFVFSLAGCGAKGKIEEKVGEKIAEKVIEKAAGDENIKVDISGDKISIKGQDGAEAIFGGTQWPEVDFIPEFTKGKVVTVVQESDKSVMIMLEEVEEKDYVNYQENIRKDFNENVYEMKSDQVLVFVGENSNGFVVQLSYETTNKNLTIVANSADN